jgi:hypothetical protein
VCEMGGFEDGFAGIGEGCSHFEGLGKTSDSSDVR